MNSRRTCLLLFALGFAVCGSLRAANDSWIGTTSTSGSFLWGTAANWNGGVPASGIVEFGPLGAASTIISYGNQGNTSITGFQVDAGAPAYTIVGTSGTITLSGSIANNGTNTFTIGPNVIWNGSSTTHNATQGTGNVTFSGTVFNNSSSTATYYFNAPLTTFAGGYFISVGASTRTELWGGEGNITVDGLGNGGTGPATLDLTIANSGTTTFAGVQTAAGDNGGQMLWSQAGTTVLTGTLNGGVLSTGSWSNGSGTTSIFDVGSGATPLALNTGANGGNATMQINGNYALGAVGAGTTRLFIIGGNTGVTPVGQGTLSLVGGAINTLTINNATAGTQALELSVTSGGASSAAGNVGVLNMEIGNNTSDQIVLANGGAVFIGTAGAALNITGIGGFTSGAATQSLTFCSAPGGGFTAGGAQFTLTGTSGNFGGYMTANLGSTNTTSLVLTLSNLAATPSAAYWTGAQGGGGSGVWTTLTGGTANNSNWSIAPNGIGDPHQTPGSTTNVYFIADTGANVSTNIGANTTIESLNFTGTDTAVTTGSAVTIDGTIAGSGTENTLTILAAGANGNPVGQGITTGSGAGADTIKSNLAISGNQIWVLNASPTSPLTISGTLSNVSGSHNLTVNGTGELVLSANNSYSGTVTIGNATVILSNTGALDGAAPDTVTFGSSSSGTLDLNGNNVTISGLSTNATPGSPVIQNANASTSGTLTINQPGSSSTYAGILQDGAGSAALGLTLSSGTLNLTAANTYSGSTIVNGGLLNIAGSLGPNSAVAVNSGGILSGTGGNIKGSVTINSGGRLMPGTAANPGPLTLSNGLTINSGGILAFNIIDGGSGPNDFLDITGNLTANAGAILQVTGGLASGDSYTLLTTTGAAPSLANFTEEDLNGNLISTNDASYSFSVSGKSIILTVAAATTAIPNITITSPAQGRVMLNTPNVAVTGSVKNTGAAPLNATLSSSGGNFTVSNFSPTSGTFQTGTGISTAWSGTIGNVGSTLGLNTYNVTVSDPSASPTSATATGTLDVLQNRIVLSSTAAIGPIHINATQTGSSAITLTSPGADNLNTRVTVMNGGADITGNGFSVSGGNPSGTFNGSTSDTRFLSGGTFTGLGAQSGTVTLTTVGEGLIGESPVNVNVGYTAQVFSGQASWASATGGSWSINGNWGDANASDLNGAGAPGLAGVASIGDTATFNNVAGQTSVTTVSLAGLNVSLAGINFNSSNGYTLSSGSITLQGAATPILVSTGNDTITSVLTGNGLNKTGTGTLILGGASNYAGSTQISNGTLQITVANALSTTTALTLGDNSNDSGTLVLGTSTADQSQALGGLATLGTGAGNSVVAGGQTGGFSTLTLSPASGTFTFAGNLGGAGANQNNINVIKTGAGAELLTGGVTYTGATTVNGGVLQVPGILPTSTIITLAGSGTANPAILQFALTGNTSLTRAVGTTTTNAPAGGLNWGNFAGFSAVGGNLTITASGNPLNNGNALLWGSNFVGIGGNQLMFGVTGVSTGIVNLTNNIELGVSGDSPDTPQIINVALGAGGDGAQLSGNLTDFTEIDAAVAKQGAGLLILSGSNNYTGTTGVIAGTLRVTNNYGLGFGGPMFVKSNANTSGTVSVSAGATLDLANVTINKNFTLNGGTLINSSTAPTVLDNGVAQILLTGSGSGYTSPTVTISGGGGTGASAATTLTTGTVVSISETGAGSGYTTAPNVTITDSGAGTGATATAVISSVAITGSNTIGGVGNITINSIISGAGSLNELSSGTLTLSAANAYTGSTTITQGVLNVINSNGSATGTGPVFIAPAGNAIAVLSGNGIISGSVNTASLGGPNIAHIAPGINTSGNFGGIGTLTLNGGLTIGNGTALDFDLGTSSDLIVVGGQLTLNPNVVLNINQGSGFVDGTYNLITYSGSLTNNTSGFSGWNVTGAPPATSFTFNSSGGVLTVTLTPTPAPANAYWSGAYGSGGTGTWNTFANSTSYNTNWLTAQTGGTDPDQVPGAATNVFFIANSGSNLNTYLGANFSINSLNFTGTNGTITTGSNVSISGSSPGSGVNYSLTLNASGTNGNTAGSGLTTSLGSGSDTINAPVILGANQTWTLNAAPTSPLTVNGTIGGSASLAIAGSGEVILAGNNTFNGGLAIDNSANVIISNAGALNSTTPDSVTFGPSSTGTLNLNGFSTAIGTLSTNATSGAPVIRNGSASAATLTVNQATNATYAGALRDGAGGGALSLTMSGSAALTLTGAVTYTGLTTVNGGDLQVNTALSGGGNVTVNNTGTLGGVGGTIAGAVTVNSGGVITSTGNTGIANPGVLALGNGLTINNGGIAAFSIVNGGANDQIAVTGTLNYNSGAIIEVTPFLTVGGTYALMTYGTTNLTVSSGSLVGISEETLSGGALTNNYSFALNSGTVELIISPPIQSVAVVSINSPAAGSRVMANTGVSISGTVSNPGNSLLSGTLSNQGGLNLTVGNFNPTTAMVGVNGALGYTANVANTGANLGNNTFGVVVTDGNSLNVSGTATSSLDVLGNRVVTGSASSVGVVHVGTVYSGTLTLSSTGADSQFTRVKVGNAGPDAFGISVSGGNPGATFNGGANGGISSDTRTVSGTFTTTGSDSSITLITSSAENGGAGLAGESDINVIVNLGASVFSGQATWSGNGGNNSWATNNNWGDHLNGTIGAPGLSGTLSIGDTASFTDGPNETVGGTTTVSLNGVNPSLAGISFSSSNTTYTIATGTGSGAITLQNGASITVTTGSDTIAANFSGTGALTINGPGMLISSGNFDKFTGSANVASGSFLINGVSGLASSGSSSYNIASGATMELSQTGSFDWETPNAFVVTGSGRFLINPNNGDLQIHGNNLTMDGTGGVIEIASGTVENGGKSGNNSIVWTNNKDSLQLDSGAVFNIWNGNAVAVDALTGSGTLTRLGFTNGNNTVNIGDNNGSGTFSGLITNQFGNLNINKTGTGLEVLTGSNSFGGYAAMSGSGTLRITNASGIGFGGFSFVTEAGQHTATAQTGATLDIYGGITVNETLTLNGGNLINSAVGTTSILDSGIAGIDFTADNSGTTSAAAPITVSIAGGSGSGATAIGATVAGGSAPLGGGNGMNLYTQMTAAGSGYTPGAAPTVTITQSGTVIGGTVTAVVSNLILSGTSNFVGGNGNLQINAAISGAGGFNTIGTGTVTLTNAETFTAGVGIAAGSTLQLGTGTAGQDGSLPNAPTIADNGLLIYDRVGSYTYSGSISGTGSLLVASSGTQILAGFNTYTASTAIASGATLQLGTGVSDGSIASSTFANSGSLVFATAGSQNLPSFITGNGSITMAGTGNQKISGNNNYTGSTIISSGTLQLGSTTALGNTSGISVSSSGVLNVSNGLAAQTVTLSINGQTLTLNNGSGLGFGVSNTGADELVISNGAVLSLTGTTFIDLSLLSGTGGSFLIISDTAGFSGWGGTTGTFALGQVPALSSGTSITQTGISVSITFHGVSTVYWKGSGTNQQGSWFDFSNFTTDAAGTGTLTGTFGPTQDVVFSASGATFQTAGTNFLDTSVSAHSLIISDPSGVDIGVQSNSILTLAGVTGNTGITVTNAAGAAQAEIDANINFTGTPNIMVNNSGGLLITGVISGSNGLIVNGNGLLTLTGQGSPGNYQLAANTFTGSTQLIGGTLNVNSDGAFGQAGAVNNGIVFNPGAGNSVTLQSGAANSGFNSLTIARTVVFNSGTGILDPGTAGNTMTISGVIAGSAPFDVVDTGELILSGSVAYTGTAHVLSGGTLALSFPGTVAQTGSSEFNVASGAVLALNSSGGQNITPAAGDAVAFTGSGTLQAGGPGPLQLHGGSGFGNIYIDMGAGGTIEVVSGSLVNGGPGTIVPSEGFGTNGNGSPLWTGTYNGAAFTNLSSLQIDAGGVFDTWNGNNVMIDALNGSGLLTRSGFFNNEAGSVVTIGDNNGSGTFSGIITNLYGTLNIVKEGTGTEIFSGNNSYSGSTLVTGGILRITSSTGLGFGGPAYLTPANVTPNASVTVTGASTLDLNGGITVNKVITLNGGDLINSAAGTTSVVDSGVAAVTLGGVQSGSYTSPSLAATSGNGSASFTAGTGNAPGGATVYGEVTAPGSGYTSAPTLSFTDSAGSGSGVTATALLSSISLAGNPSANFIGGNGNLTINAVISGASGFTTVGTGTLTLTGSNTYAGATTVASGVLVNNGYITGVVNVNPNAGGPSTLSGTGVFGGLVTTANANGSNVAHIAPGVNTSGNFGVVGTLTFKNGLVLGNGTALDFDIDAPDLLAVTGPLTLGTGITVNINELPGFSQGTYVLTTYTGALTGNTSTWNVTGLPNDTATLSTSTPGEITLTITGSNDSALTISPSPILVGSVLVGHTSGSASVTLSNSDPLANGSSAVYSTAATGTVVATPTTGTIASNNSTTLMVGSGTVNGQSGNNIQIGTLGATNSSNLSGTGNAAPVQVTANVFEPASLTTSETPINSNTTALFLTNARNDDGSSGQRAGVSITGVAAANPNFTVTPVNSSVGDASSGTGDVTSEIATVSLPTATLLNGTYNSGSITGSAQYTDPALAAQASVPGQSWSGVTATVAGNTSSARSGLGNVYSTQIASQASYAGYSLSSSVQVNGLQSHPATGNPSGNGTPTGPTTASLLAGTASAPTQVSMSFDSTPVVGPDTPVRSSDILTLAGIAATGSTVNEQGVKVSLTDKFVLQLTYDVSAMGTVFIGQNTGNGWINAVALNSTQAGNLLYANTTYQQYLTDNNYTSSTPLSQQLGAYGYSNGVAWAVLDHDSITNLNVQPMPISEFAVVPEPGTCALIFTGFGMLMGFRRLRRRSQAGKNRAAEG